jgi:hypothetical protein
MRVCYTLIALFSLVNAREQHFFSLLSSQGQTVTPHHHQPWSLLLSQDSQTSQCMVISSPEHTQSHKSIKQPGDVLILNKSPSGVDETGQFEENILEIIGFDNIILWTKANEICSSISWSSFSTDTISEYEVVHSLSPNI